VKKGHLHTMHVWWATRPLAACRAVILATLLPDPVDEHCPEEFRRKARQALSWMSSRDLSEPLELRKELLKFIGDFAAWERSADRKWVETARTLVKAAHPDGTPLVLDPFAGIGSIPFEALRVGADTFASDLNPVAVLLLKTALEYIPTYGNRLAEAVRKWGEWVREKANAELKDFYAPEPDASIPLAYLWARTIRCEGPACGAEVPLVGLLWLSRKEKQRVALRYWGDKSTKQVKFEIYHPKSESAIQPSIVRRFTATCPVCGYTTPYKRVREQLRAKGGGTRDARMLAVITLKPDRTRGFRLATARDLEVAKKASQELERLEAQHQGTLPLVPDEPFPSWYSGVFNPGLWNIKTWGDLFTARQALALVTFARLVKQAHQEVLEETGDAAFARAVATCLALAVSQLNHYLSSVSFYAKDGMISAFIQGSGLPMRPDFAEANPLMERLVGGFEYALEKLALVIDAGSGSGLKCATTSQGSATNIPLPDQSVPYVVTDPPYYAAVPYADLSDFCYVWLKRMIGDLHPDLFRWQLTPKDEEIIAYYVQPPDREPKDERFFENKMKEALLEGKRVLEPDGVAVVLFAHKGTAGWEALLNALIQAGWTVTSSWPIETERGARMRAKNSAVLASSVFLVCRPRPANAGVGDWRKVLEGLRTKVHD
jgi:adenine-specific DNA methylase